MRETPRQLSLHSLWVAYVVTPPLALGVIIFAWLGLFEGDYYSGLMYAIAVGLFVFAGLFLWGMSLMGKSFVFHSDRLEVYRFRKLLRTVYNSDVKTVCSIGNRDGIMIVTKNGGRLRVVIPSVALRKRFVENLDAFKKTVLRVDE